MFMMDVKTLPDLSIIEGSAHYKLAMERLSIVDGESKIHGFNILKDDYPYHLVVTVLGQQKFKYSVFCDGFSSILYVSKLNEDGRPNNKYKERSYARIGRLMLFLESEWNKYITNFDNCHSCCIKGSD